MIIFDFVKMAEYVNEIGLLDMDYETSMTVVIETDAGLKKLSPLPVPILGENSYQIFPIGIKNVKQIKFSVA